ncbi:hypothetical protein Pla100_60650 [Neorhodopirellula pilleata]|uniref:Uncharacterized protein n=1 Tax=Neorhodopirellula pilleata TaxID=2714738 RepID=A0A5C5ZH41_9BACT|nr:hypothetical protein Pla100_60650 [Neorhodopirellula pilleata]
MVIFKATSPLKPAFGVKVMPSRAALISDSVPLTTKLPLPLVPSTIVRPVVCDSVSKPLLTDSLTCINESVPGAESETLIALPFAALNVSVWPSTMNCGPGTVWLAS